MGSFLFNFFFFFFKQNKIYNIFLIEKFFFMSKIKMKTNNWSPSDRLISGFVCWWVVRAWVAHLSLSLNFLPHMWGMQISFYSLSPSFSFFFFSFYNNNNTLIISIINARIVFANYAFAHKTHWLSLCVYKKKCETNIKSNPCTIYIFFFWSI